jgi:hypothetical protein
MSAAKSGNERYTAPDFAEAVIGRAFARPIRVTHWLIKTRLD